MNTKLCYRCQIIKPVSDFNKNKCRANGLQTWCRNCSQQRSRKYYAENTKKHIQVILGKNRERYRIIRSKINEIKSNGKCMFCEETEPICLDFHHLDKKEKDINISRIASMGWSIEKLEKELDKCILVCSNCHRKLHAGKLEFAPETFTR